MRRIRALALIALATAIAAPARSEAPVPALLQVLGSVTSSARPVSDALVIALNLDDLSATQVWTGTDGSFRMPTLRSGIYKVIAVKQGFMPAITTVVPTRPNHSLSLKLETSKGRRSANQEIWELRALMPPDVLRELDFALAQQEAVEYDVPRFRGEMSSLTGMSGASSPAFAQTTLGVQGRIGESWQVGLRGNLQRFEDPNDEATFGTPVAESSAMSMELRSSPTSAYRVASTRSSFRFIDDGAGEQQAAISAHNFQWKSGPASVEVRYFEQEKLFRDAPDQSNVIEIGGAVPIVQTRRSDLGVSLRVTQQSIDTLGTPLRLADLSADGTVFVADAVILHYGLAGRVGQEAHEWAPRTGAEWKLTRNTSLIGSVAYKVLDREQAILTTPNLVYWSDNDRVLPRYAYSLGFVTGKDAMNRFSAIATVSAIDDPIRVIFADEGAQFWDGLEVESGDVRRDLRLAYRREFGGFAVDVATTAGTASSDDAFEAEREKVYVTGDLQSTFTPTGTTLAVSYREIQQPSETGSDDYHSERVHFRMAQSLYLPVDIKLLLGLELARSENSRYLVDTSMPDGRSKKYIGGLALNF